MSDSTSGGLPAGAALYYALSGAASLLKTHDDQPVIPVRHAEELAELRKIAELHNAQMEEAESCETSLHDDGAQSVVLSLGQCSVEAGRLYAHLTRRRHRITLELDAETDLSNVEIVVACTTDITREIITLLYGEPGVPHPICPGLVLGNDEQEISFAAKKWAVARLSCGQSPGRRAHVFPMSAFPPFEKWGGDFVGGGSDAILMEALSAKASLLVLSAHATGSLVRLSRTTNICSIYKTTPRHPNPPLCITLNRCTKFGDLPLKAVAEDVGRLVSPSIIKARVFLLYGCKVVRTENYIVDSRYSLASAIGQQSIVGACVTTWGMGNRADLVQLNSLLNEISRGSPIGLALQKSNGSPEAASIGESLCLLGDPAYQLYPIEGAIDLPEDLSIRENPYLAGKRAVELDRRSFERELIARRARYYADELPGQSSFDEVLTEFEGIGDLAAPQGVGLQQRLNDHVLDLLASVKRPQDTLLALGAFRMPLTTTTCPSCAKPARATDFGLPGRMNANFRTVLCAICGVSAVTPADRPIDLNLSDIEHGELRFDTSVPALLRGRITILNDAYGKGDVSDRPFSSVTQAWPIGADARPLRRMILPGLLPEGDLEFQAVFAWENNIAVFTKVYRPMGVAQRSTVAQVAQ